MAASCDVAGARSMRIHCERFAIALMRAIENHYQSQRALPAVYVCNCNGLRKRDVAVAIDAGAQRPRDIFTHHQCQAQCAKCVCEMREMIQDAQAAYAIAAE